MQRHLTIIILGFLWMISTSFAPDQYAKKWLFHGFTVSESIPNCNSVNTKAGYVWLLKEGDWKANQKKMENEAKEKFGSIYMEIASLDWYNYVALVKKKIKCGGSKQNPKRTDMSYRFERGKSKESIITSLDENVKNTPDVISYEIVEWIDLNADAEKLDTKKAAIVGREIQ